MKYMKRSLEARERSTGMYLKSLANYIDYHFADEERKMLNEAKSLREDYKQGKMGLSHDVS